MAYERSLWPAGIRLPKEGDEYEALDDMEVGGLTHWFGAFTGDFKATLKKGTMIRVNGPISAQAVSVSAQPVNAPEFKSTVAAESDRHSEKYAGFSLSIKARTLHEKFRLVRSVND